MENRTSKDTSSSAEVQSTQRDSLGRKRIWGLFRERSCLVPTLTGWAVLILGCLVVLIVFARSVHPFLGLNNPIPDGLLVVEGWTPDYGMAIVAEDFKRKGYQKIYVTGGPLEFGIHLAQYKTYAQLGAATLIRLGLDSNAVQAVPAPRVPRDRTYAEAVALKRWLLEHDIKLQKINLVSVGLHSRRSRLLYQKAMGKDVVIGVTSIALKEYDPRHWWRYSAGVRSVIAESVAYLYARFLFSPPKEPPAQSAQ